jgi:hypothetical protein
MGDWLSVSWKIDLTGRLADADRVRQLIEAWADADGYLEDCDLDEPGERLDCWFGGEAGYGAAHDITTFLATLADGEKLDISFSRAPDNGEEGYTLHFGPHAAQAHAQDALDALQQAIIALSKHLSAMTPNQRLGLDGLTRSLLALGDGAPRRGTDPRRSGDLAAAFLGWAARVGARYARRTGCSPDQTAQAITSKLAAGRHRHVPNKWDLIDSWYQYTGNTEYDTRLQDDMLDDMRGAIAATLKERTDR